MKTRLFGVVFVATALLLLLYERHRRRRTRKSSTLSGRYLIVLSDVCSPQQRAAAKEIVGVSLEGDSDVKALEEGSKPLATLVMLDLMSSPHIVKEKQKASSVIQENEHSLFHAPVVGHVALKAGWQDLELQSAMGMAQRLLEKVPRDDETKNCRATSEIIQKIELMIAPTLGTSLAEPIVTEARRSMELRRLRKESNSNSSSEKSESEPKNRKHSLFSSPIAVEINSLAIQHQYRGIGLGGTLANVAAAAAIAVVGVSCEIQGSAANPALVPFYLNHCAPPRLNPIQGDQFFRLNLRIDGDAMTDRDGEKKRTIDAAQNEGLVHRKELLDRSLPPRLPHFVSLHPRLQDAFEKMSKKLL